MIAPPAQVVHMRRSKLEASAGGVDTVNPACHFRGNRDVIPLVTGEASSRRPTMNE